MRSRSTRTLRMARAVASLGLFALVTSCTGESGSAPDSRAAACERLRAHVARLEVASAPTAGADSAGAGAIRIEAELDKHARNVEAALGDAFVAECLAARSSAYLDCALAAETARELAACDG